MSLTHNMHRLLTDPTETERDLLEVEYHEDAESSAAEGAVQSSFLNNLTGDLEARVVKVSKNTDQRLIVVTQDKTLLCLKRNLARLGKKDWVAPLSTVLTILISLITSNFRPALGLGPAEWRAMFIVSGFITTGWLAFTLHRAIHAKTFHEIVRDVILELSAQKRCPREAI